MILRKAWLNSHTDIDMGLTGHIQTSKSLLRRDVGTEAIIVLSYL